jgi:hypothetical protein
VCCESTARRRHANELPSDLVADGNATNNDAEHNATLNAMMALFADVMTTDEAVDCLTSNDLAGRRGAQASTAGDGCDCPDLLGGRSILPDIRPLARPAPVPLPVRLKQHPLAGWGRQDLYQPHPGPGSAPSNAQGGR